jgi:hypothetical protein
LQQSEAFDEPVSIAQFHNLVAGQFEGNRLRLKFIQSDESDARVNDGGFPSVTKGPLNIQKIKLMCGFEPSEFNETLKRIVRFYDQAYVKFPKQRNSIEKQVLKLDVFRKDETQRENFNRFIDAKSK